jgi:hypothetical protein
MRMRPTWVASSCLALAAACGGGGGGGEDDDGPAADAGAPADAGPAGGDAARVMNDDAAAPDMGVRVCLAEGGEPRSTPVGDPVPGLNGVRADVDLGGDGAVDLALSIGTDAGSELRFVDGRTGATLGSIPGPAGATLELMPGLWPRPDVLTPIALGGAQVFYVLERAGDGATALRVVDAASFADVRTIPVAGGVERLTVMASGAGWLALVDQADDGCAVYALDREAPLLATGLCQVQAAWDANGDGTVEVLRTGAAGAALLEGRTLEPLAENATRNLRVGFVPVSAAPGAPAPGPTNFRSRGPELVGAVADQGQLQLYGLDPDDLSFVGEPVAVPGVFTRLEFRLGSDGLRLIAEEERNNLRFLHVLQPGVTVRRRAEFGPFVNLFWDEGGDFDGDGYPELDVWAGPREDGLNAERAFRRVSDGEPVLTIAAERSGRFDPVLARRGGVAVPADVDGCDGPEVVLLRSGQASSARRPTRLRVVAASGAQLYQGEPLEGRVHALALGDLDGAGPFELVEARSVDDRAAQLSVIRF